MMVMLTTQMSSFTLPERQMEHLNIREALRIAHGYGLTARQFGKEILANLEQANRVGLTYKTPIALFNGYCQDIAHESACMSADLARLHDNQ
jgi:hypothetical protein